MSAPRERAVVTRTVAVTCVPDGTPAELMAGTLVQITQALGAAFTLLVDGQLMRLAGADAHRFPNSLMGDLFFTGILVGSYFAVRAVIKQLSTEQNEVSVRSEL